MDRVAGGVRREEGGIVREELEYPPPRHHCRGAQLSDNHGMGQVAVRKSNNPTRWDKSQFGAKVRAGQTKPGRGQYRDGKSGQRQS